MRNVPDFFAAMARRRFRGGFSLTELLIVVALLALIVAIAVPAFDKPDEASLDRAAVEVAAALRFAQAESQRTGSAYGVIGDVGTSTLRVYRLDDSVNPPVVVYDVYDPFTKQPYGLSLADASAGMTLASASFKFESIVTPLNFVGFAGDTGVPKYNDSGTLRMLEDGYFRIELDGLARVIAVAPITGRVTVQ